MLPRLSIGFIVLSLVVAFAACSSPGINNPVNVGPNFPTNSFYATNSVQNAISIFTVNQKGGNPAYNIGGSQTDNFLELNEFRFDEAPGVPVRFLGWSCLVENR